MVLKQGSRLCFQQKQWKSSGHCGAAEPSINSWKAWSCYTALAATHAAPAPTPPNVRLMGACLKGVFNFSKMGFSGFDWVTPNTRNKLQYIQIKKALNFLTLFTTSKGLEA